MSKSLYSQKFNLELEAANDSETEVVNSIDYRRTHPDSSAARTELDTVRWQLQLQGYVGTRLLSVKKTDSSMTAAFSLGPKIETISLSIREPDRAELADLDLGDLADFRPDGQIQIGFELLPGFMQRISDELENRGQSFSKVYLSNIQLIEDSAHAQLNISFSQQRTIDKIVIWGYDNFPSNFIGHRLGLFIGEEFSRSKLDQASAAMTGVTFAEETRPPEVLFTSDSTLIYLYLKKRRSNRFDGIIGFASDEGSSGLEFNGYLDLSLNNIFNSGEIISIYWKNNGNDRQRFYLEVETPFLLNSPLTPTINFELFRQDSTFNNISARLDLTYLLNRRSQIGAALSTETSNDLTTLGNASIASYSNWYAGGSYRLQEPLNDPLFRTRYGLEFKSLFGSRSTDLKTVSQSQFHLDASYLWSIDPRNHIFARNQSAWLNSADYLQNELYRIGGIYNLRGVNEESLFASGYSIFNLEYRYKPSSNSYFYTISDIAWVENRVDQDSFNVISFGVGYAFRTKTGILNLSYANGTFENTPFSFENSKVHVKILSYF
jgi:hypothetical protein